jgi:predicted nucleotidyltransferase
MTATVTGLGRALFSRVRLRVLGLLIGQPSRSYQLIEVISLVGSGRGAVQRELKRLANAGIIKISVTAGRKMYQANMQSPIFTDLHGLIVKTAGLVEPLQIALKTLSKRIDVAFIYGSIARESDTAKSDVDVMIIGSDIAYGDVYRGIQKAERSLQREINPTVMSVEEWKSKLSERNPFISKIAQQPKIFVIGTEDALKRIG